MRCKSSGSCDVVCMLTCGRVGEKIVWEVGEKIVWGVGGATSRQLTLSSVSEMEKVSKYSC